jgi:CheY-like chemotaxis protein
MRILLADDSTDHQLLVRSHLKPTTHRLEVVENGQRALDAFKARQIDLVMLAMRLPVLDGFAATRLMRQWEAESGLARVPILGLVGKDPDEARRAVEAGCTTCLMRPISEKALMDCLDTQRWPDPAFLWSGRGGEDVTKPIVVKIDPTLKDMIPAFLERRHHDLAELREACLADDLARIQVIGHRLKGKGTGFGFAGLSKIGDTLEAAARAGDMLAVRDGIAQLANYLERVELAE